MITEKISETEDYPKALINRRDFLVVLFQSSTFIAVGGFVRLFERLSQKEFLLRPPGSMGETHFRALCLNCGICEETCPQQVIQPVTLSEGLEGVGTPVLSFAQNYCNLCMKCTQACPTGALQPVAQAEALIGVAQVLPDRCAAWKGTNCDACVGKCPFQAIRKDGQSRPYVVEELCIGCGICEWACRLTAKQGFTKGIVVFPLNS